VLGGGHLGLGVEGAYGPALASVAIARDQGLDNQGHGDGFAFLARMPTVH
jgi:hypothetical protein